MVLRNVPRFARTENSDEHPESTTAFSRSIGHQPRPGARTFRQMQLEEWLQDEHGLTASEAANTTCRLLDSAPQIRGEFLRWYKTGRYRDIEVNGYRLSQLIKKQDMTLFGALLNLSMLAMDAGAADRPSAPRREELPVRQLEDVNTLLEQLEATETNPKGGS